MPPRSYANIAPNNTKISSQLEDARIYPLDHKVVRPHTGVDIAAPKGSPVLTPADGRVIRVAEVKDDPKGYVNYVVLQHTLPDGNAVRTVYAHLNQKSILEQGQLILAGTEIGKVGMTGGATGPHLHYEERLVVPGYEDAGRNGKRWKEGTTAINPAQDLYALSGANPDLMMAKTPPTDGHTGGPFTNPDTAYKSPADMNANRIPDILEGDKKAESARAENKIEQIASEHQLSSVAKQISQGNLTDQQKQQLFVILAEKANTAGYAAIESQISEHPQYQS
jgi:hypothetical protein